MKAVLFLAAVVLAAVAIQGSPIPAPGAALKPNVVVRPGSKLPGRQSVNTVPVTPSTGSGAYYPPRGNSVVPSAVSKSGNSYDYIESTKRGDWTIPKATGDDSDVPSSAADILEPAVPVEAQEAESPLAPEISSSSEPLTGTTEKIAKGGLGIVAIFSAIIMFLTRPFKKNNPALSLQGDAEAPLITAEGGNTDGKGMGHTVKIAIGFCLWWAFNIGYNVYNKHTLNNLYLPLIVSNVQLLVGVPYNIFLWTTGLRAAPKLDKKDLMKLLPLALFHLGVHVAGVMSLGAGAVSFTHIIKASEPVFTAIFAGLLLGSFFQWQVYAALIPVIGGVAYAATSGQVGFTVLGFITAMISNTCSALRGVATKKTLSGDNAFKPEQNMGAANLYGVLTVLSFVIMLPFCGLEFNAISSAWAAHGAKGIADSKVIFDLLASGFFYYFYNEIAFLVLDQVHPVTHALGNTLKRVAVIGSAIFIFHTPMSANGYIGSTIAILGTLGYSLIAKAFKKTYKMENMKLIPN